MTTIGVAMLFNVSVRIPSQIKYAVVMGIAIWLAYMAWLRPPTEPSCQCSVVGPWVFRVTPLYGRWQVVR